MRVREVGSNGCGVATGENTGQGGERRGCRVGRLVGNRNDDVEMASNGERAERDESQGRKKKQMVTRGFRSLSQYIRRLER